MQVNEKRKYLREACDFTERWLVCEPNWKDPYHYYFLFKKKKIKFKQRICWCASLTLKQKRKKKWNCCKRTERLSNKAVWIIIHRRSNNYSAFPFRVDVQCDSLTSCSARANSQLKIWIKNFLQLLLHINFVAYKRLPYIIVLFQRDF